MLAARALALLVLGGCGARTELDVGRAAADACSAREITLQVPATTAWTDTGIDVIEGEALTIDASGTVRYGGMSAQVTDANGGNFDGQKFFSTSVFPNAPVVSLIGRVGDTALPNGGFVGTHDAIAAPASGRLFLGFNDQKQAFADNSGAFTVTVRLTCT